MLQIRLAVSSQGEEEGGVRSGAMKAFAIESPRHMRLTELPTPDLGVEDVLLRVDVIGFCGTDLNTYRGINPLVTYPRVPGHEIGATIEKCGSKVPGRWRPGMTVTCSPYTSCGYCSACEKSRPNACKFNQTLGVQRDGALTEMIAIPWQKLFHAPDLSLSECAMIEPLAVGFHAATRGDVLPTDTVLVIGTGVVGLGAISKAASMRAARIIAVDLSERKLEIARKAGASDAVNVSTDNLHERISTLTNGKGPDLVIEAVGSVETFVAAVEEVCYAGRVVYVGYSNLPVTYETKQFLLKELAIKGSRGSTPKDFRSVIRTLQNGQYPIKESVTCTVPFDQVSSAMTEWDVNPASFAKIQVQVNQ
jgi:threonine dehydrogenase-like Zn-dependent dehydrogenase